MSILRTICDDNNISVKQFSKEIADSLQLDFEECSGVAVDAEGKKYIFIKNFTDPWERTTVVAHEIAHHLLGHKELTEKHGNSFGEMAETEAHIFESVLTALMLWDKYRGDECEHQIVEMPARTRAVQSDSGMNKSADYIAGYQAGLQEQTDVIETHITMLERARAVLTEATRPIERKIEQGSTEASLLIHSLPHLTLLLHVADGILCDSLPELNSAVNRVYGEAAKNAG